MTAAGAAPDRAVVTDIGCPASEVALLGCLLRLPSSRVLDVAQRLQADDLVDPRHRVVLAAALQVAVAGHDPDPTLVLGQLRRQGAERSFTADRAAGTYLLDVYGAAGVPANVDGYLRVVLEHRYRRRVVEASARLDAAAGTAALDELRQLVDEQVAGLRDAERRLAHPAAPLRVVG